MLKPYEAVRVDPEINKEWIIDLQSGQFGNTSMVREIDVKDSVIYILSGNLDNSTIDSTTLGSEVVKTAGFLIDLKQKTEKGFSSILLFNKYIIKNKYAYPQWLNIDSLSNALGKGRRLPWLPKKRI